MTKIKPPLSNTYKVVWLSSLLACLVLLFIFFLNQIETTKQEVRIQELKDKICDLYLANINVTSVIEDGRMFYQIDNRIFTYEELEEVCKNKN